MNITKQDVLRKIDDLSETELRIVYTFIEEFRIAEAERSSQLYFDKDRIPHE
ncbi:hypothetical protein [Salipaludibacillus keqinensis]|uniref:hypothetical protein n=1 Tax=Salipaludibacillus keqinensis TaxID=2045207 RepID=UPI0018EE9F3E|nr:hypothetical protein [Salipaludibacillus keqinensis]